MVVHLFCTTITTDLHLKEASRPLGQQGPKTATFSTRNRTDIWLKKSSLHKETYCILLPWYCITALLLLGGMYQGPIKKRELIFK